MFWTPDVLKQMDPREGVIVGVSGGKDSVVTLDLCRQHFARVEAYHLYVVPGIGFVERYLEYLERRFEVTIHRRPSFILADALRSGMFRAVRLDVPAIKPVEIEAAERARCGLNWIATGLKKCDSLERRGMLSRWGAIDRERHKLYPIADMSQAQVQQYLREKGILLPPDYALWGRSWGYDLGGRYLSDIRRKWPEDFAKILKFFPLCGAEADQWEMYGKAEKEARRAASIAKRRRKREEAHEVEQVPGIHDDAGASLEDQPGEV